MWINETVEMEWLSNRLRKNYSVERYEWQEILAKHSEWEELASHIYHVAGNNFLCTLKFSGYREDLEIVE